MRIPFRTALFCAAAGALAYLNSAGGLRAVLVSAAAAGAAFAASATARRETRETERNVTAFAKSLLAKRFPHYGAPAREGRDEMAKTLNEAARALKSRLEAADRQSARFSAVLNEASEGVLCVSKSGRITVANKAARAMLAAPDDVVGRNYWEAVFSASMRQLIRDALETGARSPIRREITNLYPSENFYMASAVPPSKERNELVLILFDSTEFRKLETAQKDLTANISHEIRTPLTSITGAAERIADHMRRPDGGGADEETEKLALILERNTKRLADLCSRIITLSELEGRKNPRDGFRPFSLSDAAQSAADLVKTAADRKNIAVTVGGGAGLRIEGDRLMIENMLVNLIENAVKYSPEGGKVEVALGSDESGNVKVAVKDRGEGIRPEDAGRIFERFYRASGARGERGSGLGLSIARQAAEIHGGTITVESGAGSGSVFTVRLPGSTRADSPAP